MPRALRGRFEPLDHFVLSHLSTSGLSLPWSPHAAKRFIGLAIVVRGKLTHHTSLVRRTYETDIACGFDLAARRFAAMARAAWLVDALIYYAACWLARRITGAKGQKAVKLLPPRSSAARERAWQS